MNKVFIIAFSLAILSAQAHATPDTCADGAGYLLYGQNGTPYCSSRMRMNWWSAIAWCRSLGGNVHLIDLTEECPYTGGTSQCPNLVISDNGGIRGWWSLNTPTNTTVAYTVDSDGSLNDNPIQSSKDKVSGFALCVDFPNS